MWFPHRFSISGPKVTPKGLVDVPDPQGAPFQAQLVVGCNIWIFSSSGDIFMNIRTG